MRENYFKSFFKSFGFFPVVLAILGIVGIGYLSLFNKVGTETLMNIVSAGVLFTSVGFLLLGFSGLKREQISLNDFTRCVFMISSIALGVLALIGTPQRLWFGIGYFVVAGLFLIQIIIRLVKCVNGDPNRSYRNYFGALAGAFNPILVLILGLLLSAAVIVLGTYLPQVKEVLVNIGKYKYLVFGICAAILLMTLITASIDKDTEVTFIDFILAVLFVATTAEALFVVPLDDFGTTFQRYSVIVACVIIVCILVRALTYAKEKSYVNSMHKVRTYFKSAFDKYDLVLPFLFGVAALVILAISIAGAKTESNYYLINVLIKNNATLDPTQQFIFALIPAGLLVLGIILTFIYHKFTSQDIERVDKILPFLLYTSSIILLFELYNFAVLFKFDLRQAGLSTLIVLVASAVTFIYAMVVQLIRLSNYNPIAAFVTTQPYKSYTSQPTDENADEAQPTEGEEETVEEEEEADPFGLTAEDEAIYEAIYGKDADAQEEEEVVEEVAEEEPTDEETEEVIYEEVPAEEEVVYEEVPAEEVAEEVPAEEESAEDAEEEADEEEAEDEAEEVEEEPEGEEEVIDEPVEEKKESNIVIQEFQVVDENGEPKKIKRKFNTKMMFAPYETKEYYNEIKNYLTMYRAKSRASSRCETYRYKGLVAKVALGGKSVKVFLALDTSIIDENPKYHLRDFSEKKQYQEVPVMIKVRSPRSLKYFKELVDIMMANRGVKPKRNFEPTDYMPQLIPNGEAILASLGMSTYYLQNTMNVKGIPDEMPDDLDEYIPMIAGDPLDDEEMEANVYLDTLCQHFEDGAEVTIDILKSLHIVKNGNVIHIKARGTLDRKLIIYAEYFDPDALKMLMCTNGTAVKIVRD